MALAPLALPCWAQPALPLDEVMTRLAQAPQGRARFTEEKRLIALTAPLHSEGQLAFRKPDHLEKLTTAPRSESLVVDGDQLTVTDGTGSAPRVVPLAGQPEIKLLVDTIRGAVSGDLALLRRFYDVSGSGTPAEWLVVLRPRDPGVARLVREVRLAGGAALGWIQSVSPNGDSDTMTITPFS